MLITYLDTSALLKRYVTESGSDSFREWLLGTDRVGTALITHAEMAAALAKSERMKWIGVEAAKRAWENFLVDWNKITVTPITDSIITRASRLAWDFGLRGYDATHLASALVWGETLNEKIILGTFDRQLWQAAKLSGLKVWPEDLSVYF